MAETNNAIMIVLTDGMERLIATPVGAEAIVLITEIKEFDWGSLKISGEYQRWSLTVLFLTTTPPPALF